MNPENQQPIVGDMGPTQHEVPDWQKNIMGGASNTVAAAPEQPFAPSQPNVGGTAPQVIAQQFEQVQEPVPSAPISVPVPASAPTQRLADPVAPGSKNYVVTLLFATFFGYYGIDRFYLGKYITAVIKLLTGGGLGLWVLYDIYRTGMGKATAKDGSSLAEYDTYGHIGRPVTKAILVVFFVGIVITNILVAFWIMALVASSDGNLEIESSPQSFSSETYTSEDVAE